MNTLAIDVGNYSIKFLTFKPDRKSYHIIGFQEVFLDKIKSQIDAEATTHEIQYEIIRSYLSKTNFDGKIIYQYPSELITSRYLEIPVAQKKKALQMVPFQLEESLPFNSSQIHYFIQSEKIKNKTVVHVNITEREPFEDVYQFLKSREILPNILSTELSLLHTMISGHGVGQDLGHSYCVLDLGHASTKAYFVLADEIVNTHRSVVAGHMITDTIANTYNITDEEAKIYKHENAFVLDNFEEAEDLTKEQREFARLMDSVFSNLIKDFQRWELGHLVKHGIKLEKIYVTGGTSLLKNIIPYLSSKLSTDVYVLPNFNTVKSNIEIHTDTFQRSFWLTDVIAKTQKTKIAPGNFLIGEFSEGNEYSISLYSSTFVAIRAFAVSFVLVLLLLVERFVFISPNVKNINREVDLLLKKGDIFSKVIARSFTKTPENLLKRIKIKNQQLNAAFKIANEMSSVSGTRGLIQISRDLSENKEINLVKFEDDNGFIKAVFSSTNADAIKILESTLKKARWLGFQSNRTNEDKTLEIGYQVN